MTKSSIAAWYAAPKPRPPRQSGFAHGSLGRSARAQPVCWALLVQERLGFPEQLQVGLLQALPASPSVWSPSWGFSLLVLFQPLESLPPCGLSSIIARLLPAAAQGFQRTNVEVARFRASHWASPESRRGAVSQWEELQSHTAEGQGSQECWREACLVKVYNDPPFGIRSMLEASKLGSIRKTMDGGGWHRGRGQCSGLGAFQIRRKEGKENGFFGHLKETRREGQIHMARSNTLVLESDKNAGLGRDS